MKAGKLRRFSFASQVLIASILAVLAAGLVVELGERNFLRFDLSRAGRNSLDPALEDLIQRLPGDVQVDCFFRPLGGPYARVSQEAEGRFLDLLFTARNAHRDRFHVELHDLADLAAVQARQAELGVQGVHQIVVSSGERRAVIPLYGRIADIDWGQPTREAVRYLSEQGIPATVDPRTWTPDNPQPPRLQAFHGGEELAQALAKVTAEGAPKVYFSVGHGEPDLAGTGSDGLARLRRGLERDGFEVAAWDSLKMGALPEDCELLAVIGPDQPWPERDLAALRDHIATGGRLITAVSRAEVDQGVEGGLVDFLGTLGIQVQPGWVCRPITAGLGDQAIEGDPFCAELFVQGNGMNASHPLTEPFRRRDRRVRFSASHSFRRGGIATPGRGLMLDLLFTPADAWRDLPDANGIRDWVFDMRREGKRDRMTLCTLAQLPTELAGPGEALRQTRCLAFASAGFLGNGLYDTNREFLISSFNWMAERDFRVGVSSALPQPTLIDVARGSELSSVTLGLGFVLPAIFVGVGCFISWRRRRA